MAPERTTSADTLFGFLREAVDRTMKEFVDKSSRGELAGIRDMVKLVGEIADSNITQGEKLQLYFAAAIPGRYDLHLVLRDAGYVLVNRDEQSLTYGAISAALKQLEMLSPLCLDTRDDLRRLLGKFT